MARKSHMGGVLLAGLAGLAGIGGLVWWGAKGKVPKALTPSGTVTAVTGGSGAHWISEIRGAGPSQNSHVVTVYWLPPGEKGGTASAMVPVVDYIETIGDKSTRTVAKVYDSTATGMNAAAAQDLGIKTA